VIQGRTAAKGALWVVRVLLALAGLAVAQPAPGGEQAGERDRSTLVTAGGRGKGPAWALTPLADGALTGEKAATMPLSSLKPAERPLLTEADLLSYDLSSHRFTLPAVRLLQRVEEMQVGKHRWRLLPLLVQVHGETRFLAAIDLDQAGVPAPSSRSPAPSEDIIAEVALLRPWDPLIALDRQDMRDDKLVRMALQGAGLLRGYTPEMTRPQVVERSRRSRLVPRWPALAQGALPHVVPADWSVKRVHFVRSAHVWLRGMENPGTLLGPYPVRDAWLVRWERPPAQAPSPVQPVSDAPPASQTGEPGHVWVVVFDRTKRTLCAAEAAHLVVATYPGMDPYSDAAPLAPLATPEQATRRAMERLTRLDTIGFVRSVEARTPNERLGAQHTWSAQGPCWVAQGLSRTGGRVCLLIEDARHGAGGVLGATHVRREVQPAQIALPRKPVVEQQTGD
jgi:hypothetical protein